MFAGAQYAYTRGAQLKKRAVSARPSVAYSARPSTSIQGAWVAVMREKYE